MGGTGTDLPSSKEAESSDGGRSPSPSGSRRWRPLRGAELLDRLRATGRQRPKANPELAPRLSRLVMDGVDTAGVDMAGVDMDGVDTAGTGGSSNVVVTKDRLTRVLACEAHYVATEFGDRRPSVAMARGVLVDALFRQLVTTGSIEDPMADGLAALALDDQQHELVPWISALPPADRLELESEVIRQAAGLVDRWPSLDPGWLPRTQEAMRANLADGAVQLSARVDLVIGRPAVREASMAIVEVKSGKRRIEHRADLHFYALVQTLRSGVPPFVVATYYTGTGELDVEAVTDELLLVAARRTGAGVRGLVSLGVLGSGATLRRTPNNLCGICSELSGCEPGSSYVESRWEASGGGADGDGPYGDGGSRAESVEQRGLR